MPLFLRRLVQPEPEPTSLTVEGPGGRIGVALRRRPGAKRMTLRVSSATGAVALTMPSRTDLAAARRFLDAHAGWIAARMARLPGRVAFEPGTLVPLRGVPHRIRSETSGRGPVRVAREDGAEPALVVRGDPAVVPGRVRRFLHAEAERDLREAVTRHAGRLGAPFGRITIRDTTSRWGSCSSAGSLSFSWRLILAPPFVLDYLAAHEVAHLRELNHSHRFWASLRALCPQTDEAEAWLKRHGAELHRYG